MSYSDFLETRVFQPLGMVNSSCHFEDGNPDRVRLYEEATGTLLPSEYANLLGSGGIASTAEDVCRFGQTLWTGALLQLLAYEGCYATTGTIFKVHLDTAANAMNVALYIGGDYIPSQAEYLPSGSSRSPESPAAAALHR
jgi:CubicO group peptidase (beta-lactamase class C family)